MNPHPPLTAFPFVIFTLLFIVEVLNLISKKEAYNSISLFLVFALIVFSPITYYSGFWGADFASKDLVEQIDNHQSYARFFLISLVPFVLVYFLKRQAVDNSGLRLIYYIFLLLSFTLVVYTSLLGGSLVFDHGAGVS